MKLFIHEKFLKHPLLEELEGNDKGELGLVLDSEQLGKAIKDGRVYPSVIHQLRYLSDTSTPRYKNYCSEQLQ